MRLKFFGHHAELYYTKMLTKSPPIHFVELGNLGDIRMLFMTENHVNFEKLNQKPGFYKALKPSAEAGLILESEPLVSVIIPVYNVAPFLKDALDSVIHQTYGNLEILIIDDGSSDGSGEICDEYSSDQRVKVFHQKNQGLSAARNVGLDMMRGEYLSFLDPDDTYHLDYIEIMLNCMFQVNTDIVVSKYKVYRSNSGMNASMRGDIYPAAKQGLYNRTEALRAIADRNINVSVWNKLYKRQLWDEIRFPAGHNYEDIDITYRIFDISESVFILEDILYLHRKRTGSITETITLKNIWDRSMAFGQEKSFIASRIPDIFTDEQYKKIRQAHLKTMIIQYIQSKDATLLRELEDQITELGKEIGLQNMSFKTRTAYQMMRSLPCLLMIIYSLYHPVRMLIWRFTGR